MSKQQVGIIMGSQSDLKIMKEAAEFLEEMGIAFELTVVSAHRTPQRMFAYASTAAQRNLKVIIAGAGGAAHLPGMVAACTTLPNGVPVATVALNAAKNAGILAAQILATSDKKLAKKLNHFKADMQKKVEQSAKEIATHGWQQS
jgi:5-(carboxyamino)imidazole ribonucleotide mutase